MLFVKNLLCNVLNCIYLKYISSNILLLENDFLNSKVEVVSPILSFHLAHALSIIEGFLFSNRLYIVDTPFVSFLSTIFNRQSVGFSID